MVLSGRKRKLSVIAKRQDLAPGERTPDTYLVVVVVFAVVAVAFVVVFVVLILMRVYFLVFYEKLSKIVMNDNQTN